MPKIIYDPNRPNCCGRPMGRNGVAQSGRVRWSCSQCKTRTTLSGESEHEDNYGYDHIAAEAYHKEVTKHIKQGGRVVVTCAQNNSRVHLKQLKTLLKYCDYFDAKLVVIPMHHKNISLFQHKEYKKQWSQHIQPYIIDKVLKIGWLDVRADIKIAATMFNPLSGKEPISGNRWAIFGHPQFAMQTVCDITRPKRMYTSGSITMRNYSQTNAGAKAEFHHVQGALIVECKKKKTYVRQLNSSSDGSFYDLDKFFSTTKVKHNQRVSAIVPGDGHLKHMFPCVKRAIYTGVDSVVKVLRPLEIVHHDLLDFYSGSHHHDKNDVLLYRKYWLGDNDVKQELDDVVDFLNTVTPRGTKNIIVASNHHEHLYKWLAKVDPKHDPKNALLIHELKLLQYKNSIRPKTYDPYDTDPFRLYTQDKFTCDVKFLRRIEHYFISGIDVSQHGDVGPNGSRGNARALSKATHKMMIGHSHGACIVRGVYQVGKSSGTGEYERGLSNHTNTFGVIYENGKRALVDIFGDDWRA